MQSDTYAVALQCGGSSSIAPPHSWGIGCVASYSQVTRSPWRCLWGTVEQRQAGQASPEESCRVGTKQICKSLSSGKKAYRYSGPIKHLSRCSAHVGHFKYSKCHLYSLSYKAVFRFQTSAIQSSSYWQQNCTGLFSASSLSMRFHRRFTRDSCSCSKVFSKSIFSCLS